MINLSYKSVKRSLIFLAFIFVVLIAIASFLLTTTSGLFVCYKIANLMLPGRLKITHLRGQALNHIQADNISYKNNQLILEINQFNLDWRLADLLTKHLTIYQLDANVINVELLPGSPDKNLSPNASSKIWPRLPVSVQIDKAQAAHLQLIKNQTTIAFNGIDLKTTLTNQQWQFDYLNFNYLQQHFNFTSRITPNFPYPVSAELKLKPLHKSSKALTGQVRLTGNFARYQWQGHSNTPSSLTWKGTLANGKTLHTLAVWQHDGKLAVDGLLSDLRIKFNSTFSTPIPLTVHATVSVKSNIAQGEAIIKSADGKTFNSVTKFNGNSSNDLSFTSNTDGHYYGNRFTTAVNFLKQHFTANIALGNNHLQINGSPDYPWQLSLNLPDPAALYPSLASLKTTISATGELQSATQGFLKLSIKPGSFHSENNTPLPFDGGVLQAILDNKQLSADGTFSLDAHKKLTLTMNLPGFALNNLHDTQPIAGKLNFAVNSLNFIEKISSGISRSQGQLTADLIARGTVKEPVIEGNVQIKEAGFSIKNLGLDLTAINFSLQTMARKWQTDGSLLSNGTPIHLNGTGEYLPVLKGNLTIEGDNIPILNTSEYTINLSPKLNLEFAPQLLKLRGNILVPKALLKPQTFTDSVSMTEDAVFTGESGSSSTHILDTDIDIAMGKEVILEVKGLRGNLHGGINLRQLPGGTLNASGELNIHEGKYQAYGQDLIIEQGELLFTGTGVDNPGIRVKAIRNINRVKDAAASTSQLFDFHSSNLQSFDLDNKTTVGIEIAGRIKTPKVKLFSVPATLSQADILSMLLLGRPANQANQSGGQLLLAAVSALNLDSGSGGLQLLSQLKHSLGVDINIETPQYNQSTNQSASNTAFMLGKALSKRLYLSYNLGISQSDNNVLTLKYLLNRFFSIQVSASMTSSAVDMLYTYQKDKND